MDEKTSFLALAAVAASVVFILLGVGLLRRRKCYLVYTIGTVAAIAGLLSVARSSLVTSPAIGIIAPLSMWLYALFMACGLRIQIGIKPAFQIHFIGVPLSGLLALVLLHPAPIYRVTLTVLGVFVFSLDWAATIRRGVDRLPERVGRKILVVPACMLAMPLLQLAYLLLARFGTLPSLTITNEMSLAFGYLVFLMIVSTNLAIGLDLALVHEELRQKNVVLAETAVTDILTGLGNRKLFEARVAEEISRSDRLGHEVSMIMLDLDKFKEVNDTYGHHVGDEVLRLTAAIARGSIRTTDSIYRWGGEELVIIAPGTELAGALNLAEKMRASMANAKYPVQHHVTASFGVAEYRSGENAATWFKRADSALYRAKSNGRNRVEAYESDQQLQE